MKNQKNKLLLLISLGMSMHMLTAAPHIAGEARAESSAKSPKIVTFKEQSKNAVSLKQQKALHEAAKLADTQAAEIKYRYNSNALSRSQSAANGEAGLKLNDQIQSSKPTPADILIDTLQRSTDYTDAFNKLNDALNESNTLHVQIDPAGKLLIQQARTLLVRAHPEVIPNLTTNLRLLPNRFVSYFKEMRPRLSTNAGKKRFTQSVMMEALKAMDELPQTRMSTIGSDKINPLTPEQNKDAFNPEFAELFNDISAKYTSALDRSMENNSWSTQARLVAQWSRNLITELALLAPRTAGAAVGATAGFMAGISINYGDPAFPADPISGAINFGTAGAQAGEGLARYAANTAGRSARYVARGIDSNARAAYSKGSELFTPRKKLATETSNLTKASLNAANPGRNRSALDFETASTDSYQLDNESLSSDGLYDY